MRRPALALLLLGGAARAEPVGEVSVSGVVAHSGSGAIRLELLLLDDEGGAPLLVQSMTLASAGPFSMQAPAGLGRVRVRAAYDPDGDGVGPADAQGLSEPVVVGASEIQGLEITLRRPDLAPTVPR